MAKKNSKIEWNKITWYSKLGAIIVFVGVLPTVAFFIGIEYAECKRSFTAVAQLAYIVPAK